MYRLVIWDFGGTLVDSYPAVVAAFEAALADFGYREDPETIRALARQSRAICTAALSERFGIDEAALGAAYTAHYRAQPPSAQPPFPGAAALCRRIQAAGGLNVIFTHRSQASLLRLLDAHGMTDLFVELLATEDGVPRKPDPAGLLLLMAHHNAAPEDTLAVGDRPLDIEAGHNAGVTTCFFGEEVPAGLHPDYAVTSYAALEAILFPEEAG